MWKMRRKRRRRKWRRKGIRMRKGEGKLITRTSSEQRIRTSNIEHLADIFALTQLDPKPAKIR